MTEDELRALAQVAFRSPRSPECLPQWISDLAILPPPSFHAHDKIRHAGLIAFDGHWYVTDAGWRALEGATPAREVNDQCADCGAEIVGAHGHCPGVPGGFGDD